MDPLVDHRPNHSSAPSASRKASSDILENWPPSDISRIKVSKLWLFICTSETPDALTLVESVLGKKELQESIVTFS